MRDTIVLLTATADREALKERISRFREFDRNEYFTYLSCGECVFGIDDSGDVLEDFEENEKAAVVSAIGKFHATLVEYQSMDCVSSFLQRVLPGLKGLIDTNYGDLLSYEEVLTWLRENPGRHFRDGMHDYKFHP